MFMLHQTSVKMAVLLHKQASDRFHSLLTVYLRNHSRTQISKNKCANIGINGRIKKWFKYYTVHYSSMLVGITLQ